MAFADCKSKGGLNTLGVNGLMTDTTNGLMTAQIKWVDVCQKKRG